MLYEQPTTAFSFSFSGANKECTSNANCFRDLYKEEHQQNERSIRRSMSLQSTVDSSEVWASGLFPGDDLRAISAVFSYLN